MISGTLAMASTRAVPEAESPREIQAPACSTSVRMTAGAGRIRWLFPGPRPAAEMKKSAPRAHRLNRGGKNGFKPGQQPLVPEILIGLVMVEEWLTEVFQIKRLVAVDLHDFLDERLLVRE